MGQLLQIAGALMVLAGFALAQAGRIDATSRGYLLLNLVGSAVLAVEAYLGSQWGFLLLEAAWALVSARGSARRRGVSRPDRAHAAAVRHDGRMTVVAGLDACRSRLGGGRARRRALHDGRGRRDLRGHPRAASTTPSRSASTSPSACPPWATAPGRPITPRGPFVGPRRGSVFPTRAARRAARAELRRSPPHRCRRCRRSRTRCGGRSSRSMRHLTDRVFEAHPEVSFGALAGAPMMYPKRTWNGLMERRRPARGGRHRDPGSTCPDCDAAADDVLDAAAVAWTAARKARGAAISLPADPPGSTAGRLRSGTSDGCGNRSCGTRPPCWWPARRPGGRRRKRCPTAGVSWVSGRPQGGNAAGTPFVYQNGTFTRDRSGRWSM